MHTMVGVALGACDNVDEPEDARHDAGTDTDADTDSDSDSDADTDTGSEPLDPGTVTEVVFEGEPGGTAHGGFTTVEHDMDGDGLDEVLILDYGGSVPDTTSYPEVRGAVYVFYGRESWSSEYSVLDADAILRGGQEAGTAGGDFDGDGLGDLAYTSRDGVHLIYGSATRLDGELLSTEAGVHFAAPLQGATNVDYLKVSGGHDLDGDDLADLLIDVRWEYSAAPDMHRTYVLLGQEEPLASPFNLNNADAVFDGDTDDYEFCLGSGMAGDVDGDGFGDVLISLKQAAAEADDEVATALFYGESSLFDGTITPLSADAVITTPPFWLTLGGLGDLDQDGLDDFVLPQHQSLSGVYGAEDRIDGEVELSSVAAFTVLPEGTASYMAGLATADLNGDTWLDIVVGDPHDDTEGYQTGALFVIYGDGGQLSGDFVLDESHAVKYGLYFEDDEDMGQGEDLGYGLGGGGDVDGNDCGDVLVGAPGDAIGDDYGGTVYMLLGNPPE
jgi:hypothetical protein